MIAKRKLALVLYCFFHWKDSKTPKNKKEKNWLIKLRFDVLLVLVSSSFWDYENLWIFLSSASFSMVEGVSLMDRS